VERPRTSAVPVARGRAPSPPRGEGWGGAASRFLALASVGEGPGAALTGKDRFAAALAAGDRAFEARDDEARLRDAIRAYGDAAAELPGEPRAELSLARAWLLLGAAAPRETPGACDAAARASERALRALDPDFAAAVDRGDAPEKALGAVKAPAAAALYWFSLAALEGARARGFAAVLAVREAVRAGLQRAAALDERVDHGGPHRALGDLLAGLPTAAGGGAAAAREHFDRALALAPDYQLTRVLEAERLAVLLQDRKLFDLRLAEVAGFDLAAAPALAPENALARRLGAVLRKRADRLF
jgi:hypothetical protein